MKRDYISIFRHVIINITQFTTNSSFNRKSIREESEVSMYHFVDFYFHQQQCDE